MTKLSRPSLLMSFALGVLASVPAQATDIDYIELGAMRIEGAFTLDATVPMFHFTTLELAPGSTLHFDPVSPDAVVRLIASQWIRIDGSVHVAPAAGLYLEAPQIDIGGTIDAPGRTVALVGRDPIQPRPPLGQPSRDGITIQPGATIVLSNNNGILYPDAPIRVGLGGSIELSEGSGIVVMQAPVPEPETWAMLGVGLGLVVYLTRRRKAALRG